jgi:HTH-type transcriptional regulator, transcriptional repressor of NAD biosynthesis genes
MYKIGVFAGKFMPPHRGHLSAIINSATQCETLYVVVSDNVFQTKRLCKESNLPTMYGLMRTKWLSQELQGFDHIKVLFLDESDIPEYPLGWSKWSARLKELIPAKIDVLFGGDPEYKKVNDIWFPQSDYILFDYSRERYPISATLVRNDPFKYWDYILGSARPFFTKKILITGTESAGKTTTTKYLAKIFHTSWSEEVGRYYSNRYLGNNESVFVVEDFGRIAYLQYEADMDALHKANKIVFYDSDAVATQYYANLYLHEESRMVESFIDPKRYDITLMFTPSVAWVPDGLRWNQDQKVREKLHLDLLNMYKERGFDNIVVIDGNYNQRLEKCIEIAKNLIGENQIKI